MLDAGQRCECVITNISDRGAHISIADSDALPDSFVLLLAENGATRRRCRVIWRKPREIGIKSPGWTNGYAPVSSQRSTPALLPKRIRKQKKFDALHLLNG